MPTRTTPLISEQIYHIINRGVALQPIFLNKRDYSRAQATFFYYQNCNLSLRYSKFMTLPQEERSRLFVELKQERNFWAEIIAYCFMPNHFHLLLKQIKENGLSIFIKNFTDSYTRYFNTKRERNGPLFEGRFKAVRIETDEQLLHVTRYIHLNPYSSYVVKTLEDLENYPYSSFPEYLNNLNQNFCNKEIILSQFRDRLAYKQFVFDQADYQRELENIKHLLLEA